MTVSSQTSSVSYLGDGVTTLLPVPYYFLEQTDLVVTRVNTDNSVDTLVLGSDYSVSGAGVQAGGAVTMLSPPISGVQIIINRVVPVTQETDYVANDPFPAESHERALDKLTMLVQQAFSYLSRALLRPVGKNDYDAEGRKIVNLGDGADDTDAVNIRTMRSYVDSAIAGIVGGFGFFIQNGIGAIARTFQDKMRDVFHVRDFGAVGDGVTDDAAAINRASAAVVAAGGGVLMYGEGVYLISSSIIIDTGVVHTGQGFGVTTIAVKAGANCDAFITRDFASLTGVGPITAAPYAFGVIDLTIQGNYLDLGPTWKEISWRDSNTVLNSVGCGVRIFGTRYELRIEVFNVADNAMYLEAIGTQFDNSVTGARIFLDGRISGYEGVIMRGPGDSGIDMIGFGLCGILPLGLRATTASLPSRVYPADQVNGFVIDNAGIYEGHCEVDFTHIYAVSFGYGIKFLGTCRIGGRHMATDACLGGICTSTSTHGLIAIAEARGNGRQPTGYTGAPIAPLPDLKLDNGGIWALEIHMKSARFAPSGNDSNYAIQITGSNNLVYLTRQGQTQGDGLPLLSPYISVTGDNNVIDFTCKRQRGNVLYLAGNTNIIRGTVSQLYASTVFTRDTTAGKPCFGNSVEISAEQIQTTGTGFNAIGNASSENIRLLLSGSAGYTKFTGDKMVSLNRAVVWTVMALDGSSINGKSTEDYIEVVIPTTPVSGTINVPHNFLYAPDTYQVAPHVRYPSTVPDQLVTIGVLSADATNIVLGYRWSALPTTGAATAVVHVR